MLDIETAPNLAYVWGLWQQNIATNQIARSSYVLCWSAKWCGEDEVFFDSVKKSKPKTMLRRIHRLLEEADVVVHYNGQKFDVPVLNKEFIIHGLPPPAPYKQVDLLKVCKRLFRFESNKLDYVSQALAIGEKVRHEGHELWVKCMAGERDAWARMEAYNRQDVALLESLYQRLLPWIDRHPNHGAFEDIAACPNCGGEKFQQRGYAVTTTYKYRRYQCRDCGKWFRDNKTVSLRLKEKMVSIAT